MQTIPSSVVFSLGWRCGACETEHPTVTSTADGWLLCPRCGTKYDLKDLYISGDLKNKLQKLDNAGIAYLGGRVYSE